MAQLYRKSKKEKPNAAPGVLTISRTKMKPKLEVSKRRRFYSKMNSREM